MPIPPNRIQGRAVVRGDNARDVSTADVEECLEHLDVPSALKAGAIQALIALR